MVLNHAPAVQHNPGEHPATPGGVVGGVMDGSLAGSGLTVGLKDRQVDFDRMIAAEQARVIPDEILVRRLMRERMLARDRFAAMAGSAMPAWARPGSPAK